MLHCMAKWLLLASLVLASLQQGEKAPRFSLPGTDGKVYTLEDMRGKLVYLTFVSETCAPCRQEIPVLNQFYKSKSDSIVILAIMFGSRKLSKARRTRESMGIQIPLLYDPSGEIFVRYQVFALPSGFLVSERGEIIKRYFGFHQQVLIADFEREIARLEKLENTCSVFIEKFKESTQAARMDKSGSFYKDQIEKSLAKDKFEIASSREKARFILSGSVSKIQSLTGFSIKTSDMLTGKVILEQDLSITGSDLSGLIKEIEEKISNTCQKNQQH